jgi:hypothetical protein
MHLWPDACIVQAHGMEVRRLGRDCQSAFFGPQVRREWWKVRSEENGDTGRVVRQCDDICDA